MRILSTAFAILLMTVQSIAATITLPKGSIGFQVFQSGNTYNANPDGTRIVGKSSMGDAPGNTHTGVFNRLHDITVNAVVFDGDSVLIDHCDKITFNDVWVMNARRTSGNHQGIIGYGNTNLILNRVTIYNTTQGALLDGVIGGSCTDLTIEKTGIAIMLSGDNWPIEHPTVKRARASGIVWLYNTPQTIKVNRYKYIDAERYNDDTKNGGESVGASIPNANGRLTFTNSYGSGLCWLLNNDGTPMMVNGKQAQRKSGELGPNGKKWLGVRQWLEFGGPNPKIDNNLCDGINDAGAGVTTPPSAGAQVTHNLCINCLEPFDFENHNAAADAAAVGSNAVRYTVDATHWNYKFPIDGKLLPGGAWEDVLVPIQPPTTAPIPPTTQPPATLPIPPIYQGLIQFDSATGNVTGSLKVK